VIDFPTRVRVRKQKYKQLDVYWRRKNVSRDIKRQREIVREPVKKESAHTQARQIARFREFLAVIKVKLK
jgi:hypothetical protein